MRVLVVSTVAPTRCGIAAYAAQQVARLREEGHRVTVASLDGKGNADLHFRLKRATDIRRLAAILPGFDRCIVHYHHDFFFSGLSKSPLLTNNLQLAALFAGRVEVVAHEVVYEILEGQWGSLVGRVERLKWRSAKQVVVHTPSEEARLRALVPEARIVRRDHQADFKPHRDIDQAAARGELGLERDARLYLCIGFLQWHKGFDRAMQAFSAVESPKARLYVVGSARVENVSIRSYIESLASLAATDERIRLIERFVSDAEFDTWLSAADVVVLPYREIWSSGVAARARLLGKRIVASAISGLSDQLGPDDHIVAQEEDLGAALKRASLSPVARGTARTQLRLAVVPPWYAPQRSRGAEKVVRATAERLQRAGVQVEVFTTRIRDPFSDWGQNALAAEDEVAGIPVHRLPVESRRDDLFESLAERVRRGLSLTAVEEGVFFRERLRCPELPRALAARRGDFDLFLFADDMFPAAIEGVRAVGDQAVLLPFLHDDGFARLARCGEMARAARGGLFMSVPEAELAQRLFGISADRCAVVGTGIDVPHVASRFAFARRHGPGPYVVYVGRKEEAKNFPELLRWFRAIRPRFPGLRLVTIGQFDVPLSPSGGGSILDLGVVGEREKFDTLAGALAVVQPSLLESFSLSLMEAWSVGRPAIVHAGCAVTRHHVVRAGGGHAVTDAETFGAALDALLRDPKLAARLGRRGKAYVQREFAWPIVTARLLEALERFADTPVRERSAA